jgi:hypothetical protein
MIIMSVGGTSELNLARPTLYEVRMISDLVNFVQLSKFSTILGKLTNQAV